MHRLPWESDPLSAFPSRQHAQHAVERVDGEGSEHAWRGEGSAELDEGKREASQKGSHEPKGDGGAGGGGRVSASSVHCRDYENQLEFMLRQMRRPRNESWEVNGNRRDTHLCPFDMRHQIVISADGRHVQIDQGQD